jgi:translin
MDLEPIAQPIRETFAAKQASRDTALRLSRETIRFCATSIRATHRGDSPEARSLLDQARGHLGQLKGAVADYRELRYTGFIDDAQKEFAEANVVFAIVFGHDVPTPTDLDVDHVPYLNGLGEAAGELRRFVLDRIRAREFQRCEGALEAMDEIYRVLITMDFPDAMTGGLRRTTDMVRGVLERTRGDLTMAIRQQDLSDQLADLQQRLPRAGGAP